MTIKEYKKNYYKIHKKQSSDIDNNLNQSQSILLYKILKNKKLHGHILDSNTNKTTQSIYQKEENKKKVLKILKKKNYDIANTTRVSPHKKKDSGESPTFFTGNNLKSSKNKKIEDSPFNISDYKSLYDKNTSNKTNKEVLTDSFFTNKNYNDLTATASRKNIKSYKALTPLVNERNKKNFNDGKEERSRGSKNKKYDAVFKNKDSSRLLCHCNHNHCKSQKELSPISINKSKFTKKAPVNLNFNNNNTKKIENIKLKNNYMSNTSTSRAKMNENIIYHKKNNNNNPKIYNYNFNSSNIIIKKEFNNLQKEKAELFTINNFVKKEDKNHESGKVENISNLSFKNLKTEQCIKFSFKNQNQTKVISKDKDKDKIKSKKNNISNDQYTGYVLLKKNKGIIEEETKLEKDIEKIKTIFLNILNNISDDQLEFITTSELTSLKSEINENINIINDLEKEKNENLSKAEKIKEQEEIIQKKEEEYFEYQQEYLKLQSEFEKLKTEDDKLKEKINSMEKENKKILEDNSKLKDEYVKYKNVKDEKMDNEIKDLEGKIKKYKEELKKKNNNNFKNNFNMGDTNSKAKRMSFSYNYKFDSMVNSLEKKKNENKKKGPNVNSTSSKLIVIEEKKILEVNEDKEDIEEPKIENKKLEEETKVNEINNINNENNIIKDNNENKIQQPIISNDSSIHISKNEIDLNMGNNANNIQVVQKNNISTINDTNNINNDMNNIIKSSYTLKANDEKGKKMSKALNRFKKKMSQAQPNIPPKNYKDERTNERSNSCAKRSEKISGIAKMLEQQMGRRDMKFEINEENRAATDDETDRELDIVKLIEKKPTYGGRKKKPTLKIKFSKEQLDD